ncbi:MAG: aldehyde dehydrogenase family protein [Planctomycetaceae bacterium]|nr:aldehyde dehydrogenase family protein [Planctomycetaceae bacterium]
MQMIINGAKRNASDGATIDVLNPATQEVIDTVPSATDKDIQEVLEVAQAGKRLWAKTPQHERSRIMGKIADAVVAHKDELRQIMARETGKAISSTGDEIGEVSMLFRGYGEKAAHLYGISMAESQPGVENDILYTRREPLGVVVCVIPFNFPAELFAHKVAPALATGNAVVVKPSTDNPMTAIRLTEIIQECGVPGSVIQVITGQGSRVGKLLSASPLVNAISLTGSTAVGISTMQESAKTLKRCYLELGGNDACIILEDGDLDLAVAEAVEARAVNAGQICCGTKRYIVHNSVKDAFAAKLVERLKQVKVGDTMDPATEVGCLINEKAAKEVEDQVNLTVKQGAKCILGGKRFNKTFFEMTVLVDVTADMDIARDMEVFGPVFPVIGFDDPEEAVRIANQSVYGLMGGVISRDIYKALKVAYGMECGGTVINGASTYRTMEMPFGGYKMSGLGREGISHTLDEMTQMKTIILKRALQ